MRTLSIAKRAAMGLAVCIAPAANAHGNHVEITIEGDQRCISSNGTPNHDIGRFPNRGNPHAFQEQDIRICVDATPTRTDTATRNTRGSGVSVTGIWFRPGTADFYDASSPRGHSRDPSSGWRLEGMGAAEMLGMDMENAHVDNTGLYHYHGISDSLVGSQSGTLIGYAADGFEIHYVGQNAQPSWQLRDGTRPTAPFGTYDGTYEEDWEYIPGSGNLDECNGGMLGGSYVYFATDSFPFFPRCFWGTVSRSFRGRR